jgi:hypothetical protein
MSNWQLTATTILCDYFGDEVTIIVYKGGIVKCTGSTRKSVKGKKLVTASCFAEKCPQIAHYKAKLDTEEQGG